jgi:hypothetical protein
MPTVIDAPSAIGYWDQWGLGAGASKVAAVQTNDGDTTYVYHDGPAGGIRYESYQYPSLPADFLVSISVSCTTVQRRVAGTVSAGVHIYATTTGYGNIGTSYAAYSATRTEAVSRATLEAYEGGPAGNSGAGNTHYCTQVYRTVDYVPAGGFCIVDLMGALVGAAATLAELGRAVGAFNARQLAAFHAGRARRAYRLHSSEVPVFARQWREWRRPVFVF